MVSGPRVVAIIQARFGSSRLPGKVLLNIGGKTMLERVVERVLKAKLVSQVVVATSEFEADDKIVAFCEDVGIEVCRGPLEDVLERFRLCAEKYEADYIVRVTSDCPLTDPDLIDDAIKSLVDKEIDLVANRSPIGPRSLPYGLDVEAFRVSALRRAAKLASPTEREHVTTIMYSHPDFSVCILEYDLGEYSHFRWAIDTPSDLKRLKPLILLVRSFSWIEARQLYLKIDQSAFD